MLEPLGNNLVEILRRRAQEHPEKVAYIFLEDGEKREDPLTYGELDRRARAIAAQLPTSCRPGEHSRGRRTEINLFFGRPKPPIDIAR